MYVFRISKPSLSFRKIRTYEHHQNTMAIISKLARRFQHMSGERKTLFAILKKKNSDRSDKQTNKYEGSEVHTQVCT